MNTQFDLIIIGGGPAGCAGAIYASRKRLKTLLLLKDWGGQSIVSNDIQNWIGIPNISGIDLALSLKKHVLVYAKDVLEIKEGSFVVKVTGEDGDFTVTTDKNETFHAKTILITVGSSRRKLEIDGADKFEHKGLTYCASCDGPMFSESDVVVIGGGNAGFGSASQLLNYCKSVTLLSRSQARAENITVEKLKANPKFKLIENATPKSINGSQFVESVTYIKNSESFTLPCSGVFVEIGQIPATSLVKDLIKLNDTNHIITDPRNQETNVKGIWSAGDCTDSLYNQNNIAVGDAVRAVEDIYLHMHTRTRK